MDWSQRVNGVLDGAGGLPPWAYNDADFFALERDRIFARQWTCIGLAKDIPNPGDAIPVTIHGRSLILLRDQASEVGVFHNICRHRGHPILKKPVSGQRRLVCPYHSWSYHFDGRLSQAPHAESLCAAQKDGIALSRVRSAVWAGLIFVDFSGQLREFEEVIRPLVDRWSDFDLSALRHGESLLYEAECNWKLAIENFVDFYHLPSVHKVLNSYSKMEDHHWVDGGDLFFGQGNQHADPQDEARDKLPRFPGLPEEKWRFTEAVCLFPNLLITIFADHFRIILIEPLAPGRCRERVEVFFMGEAAEDPSLAKEREVAMGRFSQFNAEDIDVIESLQRAFASDDFDGGVLLDDYDHNVRRFQRRVLSALDL